MEIISVNNELVKETAKLQHKKYRDERGEFLIEGYKPISEWLQNGFKFKRIFLLKDKVHKFKFGQENLISASSAVLKKISTTVSEPEIVGVAEKIKFDVKILKNAKKILLLEGIKDSGNLGTIMRSAVAFGADALILFGNCTDLYNPKCLRSAVGNFGKIPVFEMNTVDELNKYFKDFERVATLPKSRNLLKNTKIGEPFLLMFGSEADGLSNELIDFATSSFKIEMRDNVESLNLSIACGIAMYELMKVSSAGFD